MGRSATSTMTIREAAQQMTVQAFAALRPSDVRILDDLARAYTSGLLSASAWECASGAIAGDAILRVESEGRIDFGAVA